MGDLAADPLRDQQLRDAAKNVTGVIIERIIEMHPSLQQDMPPIVADIARHGYALLTVDLMVVAPDLKRLGLRAIKFDVIFRSSLPGGLDACYARQPLGAPPLARQRRSVNFIELAALPEHASYLAATRPWAFYEIVYRTLVRNDRLLAHEIFHMFDYLRGGPEPGQCLLFDPRKHPELYINTPHEFNAHFQQGISELHRILFLASEEEAAPMLESFNTFEAFAARSEGIGALMEWSRGKWSRKLRQRLWQTWERWSRVGVKDIKKE